MIGATTLQAVFDIPTTEEDEPSKSISLALQTLFYKVRVCCFIRGRAQWNLGTKLGHHQQECALCCKTNHDW